MISIPGKIPIRIHPAFWIFAALIGFLNSGTFLGTVFWVGIILVSVLFHEFGHALSALAFGKKPRIELVALGGLTYHNSEDLSWWKQFIIIFNGPFFGFLLFLMSFFVLQMSWITSPKVLLALKTFEIVNLFWTVLNLLPILPLDGGQLLRVFLEGVCGVRGFKYALIVGMVAAVLISLLAFVMGSIFGGAIFFLFAFQNYETYRQSKSLSEKDRSLSLKKALEAIETDLQAGRKQEALYALENIRKEAKEGVINVLATQYLAYLKYENGNVKECYDLLVPLRASLAPDALFLLYRSAFEVKDYPLVVELAGSSFQIAPTPETAMRNAFASAALGLVKPAIGWLQTALEEGVDNLKELVNQEYFLPIKDDPAFKAFLSSLQ